MTAEFLTAENFVARHGFFTRRGGVSDGPYASLNCSVSSADAAENVVRNRSRVADAMGIDAPALVGVTQVHGRGVVVVDGPWEFGKGPEADAMVTCRAGVALGIVTADCAPVLLCDSDADVIGAAHAGWRGACGGVLEAVVDAMLKLGAKPGRIRAAVGPCIGQASYEVGADLRNSVLASLAGSERFFSIGIRPEHWQFDLSAYIMARLTARDVEAESLGLDTCLDEARFFSHRRRVLRGGGPIGHQISVVVAAY
jgi:YfiH family protein